MQCLWIFFLNTAHCYLCSKLSDHFTCKLLAGSNVVSKLNQITKLLIILFQLLFRVGWNAQYIINHKYLKSSVNKCSALDYVNKLIKSHPILAVTKITSPSFLLLFLISKFQVTWVCRAPLLPRLTSIWAWKWHRIIRVVFSFYFVFFCEDLRSFLPSEWSSIGGNGRHYWRRQAMFGTDNLLYLISSLATCWGGGDGLRFGMEML